MRKMNTTNETTPKCCICGGDLSRDGLLIICKTCGLTGKQSKIMINIEDHVERDMLNVPGFDSIRRCV